MWEAGWEKWSLMYLNLLRGVHNIVVRGGGKYGLCNNEYKSEMKLVFRIEYNSNETFMRKAWRYEILNIAS